MHSFTNKLDDPGMSSYLSTESKVMMLATISMRVHDGQVLEPKIQFAPDSNIDRATRLYWMMYMIESLTQEIRKDFNL